MKIDYLDGLLKYEMPQDLRDRIIQFIAEYKKNPDEDRLQFFIKEVRTRRTYTRPREEIEWYPTIDEEKCINCNACYYSCRKKVYSLDENNYVYVNKPYECAMMCFGCQRKCKNEAISFPNKEEFQKYIYYK